MIVIDVGNTNLVLGIYSKNKLTKVFRIKTEKNKKKFKSEFYNFLKSKKKIIQKLDTDLCVLSSVVPSLNLLIKNYFINLNFKFYIIDPKNIPLNVKIKYNLKQIGSDRVANFVAIYNKKISNCIIVDFGTATTFDVIKNNEYFGGLIFPGINLSMSSLVENADLISTTRISKVKKIVAHNTKSSIMAGFYFGYLHTVNGILNQIIKENKFKPKVYITGGLGRIFKDKINLKPIYNEYLTLEGMRVIGKKLNNE